MEELVRGFVDGQISRRVFIRRLVTAGVALTGAVAYADLLAADPAYAMEYHWVYVTDYVFSPVPEILSGPGDYTYWVFDGLSSGHSITESSGVGFFDSSPNVTATVPVTHYNWVGYWGWEMWAAGTFPFYCKDVLHPPMNGKVRVPMVLGANSGRVGKEFEVMWGAGDLASRPEFLYEVQLRKPGGQWKDWMSSTSPGRTYTAKTPGRHQFRARLRRISTDKTSGWSPVATFTAR